MRLLSLMSPDEIHASPRVNLEPPTSLVLVSNAITITQSWHMVIASNGAANRRLETINGGVQGDLLVLQRDPLSTANLTIVDNNGNLRTAGNFDLDSDFDTVILLCMGAFWAELARSNN